MENKDLRFTNQEAYLTRRILASLNNNLGFLLQSIRAFLGLRKIAMHQPVENIVLVSLGAFGSLNLFDLPLPFLTNDQPRELIKTCMAEFTKRSVKMDAISGINLVAIGTGKDSITELSQPI